MAAIAKTSPIFVAPPGMEVIDSGYALGTINRGDPIVISSTDSPSKQFSHAVAKATGTVAHGIALKDVLAGGHCEYACQGEMDGFASLTVGAGLTIVGGNIDNTAPAAGVTTQIRAVTKTRIRFVLV